MSTFYKLNALTSLRFVAAIIVVVAHTAPVFGFMVFQQISILTQTMSFFFVLSGFILTYNYPTLKNWEAVGRFWLLRSARIWPVHIFTIFLILFILPAPQWTFTTEHKLWVTLTNLSLLQAWIPLQEFVLSYNTPAWSLSVDIFFYVLFPILLFRLNKTWWVLLAGSFLIVMAMIYLSNTLHLNPAERETLIYTHPLSRLFEFILGMVTALAWGKINHISLNKVIATTLEFVAFGCILISMYCCATPFNWMGEAGASYLLHSGSAVVFSLFILIMAFDRGYLSRLLSFPLLVTLGEISFAIYLVHYTFLRYYIWKMDLFSTLSPWVTYIGFWAILLLTSALIWHFVDKPSRRFLIKLWPKKTSQPTAPASIIVGQTA